MVAVSAVADLRGVGDMAHLNQGSQLSQDAKARIEAKVQELEKMSSVEYVPVSIASASDYADLKSEWLLLGLVVHFFVASLFHLALWKHVLGAFAVALVIAGALRVPTLLRFVVGRRARQSRVVEAAHQKFLSEEVFATHARTGVLILVSEFERAVFVLADKGLSAHVSDQEWAQLAQSLAHEFQQGKSEADTFLAGLTALSQKLAVHFPPSANHVNELPNRVR